MDDSFDESAVNPNESGNMNLTMNSTAQLSLGGSMASAFKGRNTAKSADELKKARESRAAEALKMKDEQLRILSDQNASLLSSLDKVYYTEH
jgi:myosin protein heavy chain